MNKKLNNREMLYHVGELPTYGNGAHPWCNCQDVPYDDPNPWGEIETFTAHLTET